MGGALKARAVLAVLIAMSASLAGCLWSESLSSDEIHETIDGLGYEVTYEETPDSSTTVVTGVAHGPRADTRFWVASGEGARDQGPDWANPPRGFGSGGGSEGGDLWVWTQSGRPHDGVGSSIRVGLCEERIDSSCAP